MLPHSFSRCANPQWRRVARLGWHPMEDVGCSKNLGQYRVVRSHDGAGRNAKELGLRPRLMRCD